MTAASVPSRAEHRPAEFDARVMSYVPGLKKLARRYTKTEEQREDLVTDTIMHALDKWQNFRADGGFWNWLSWSMRGIAKESAIKATRKKARATMVPIEDYHHLSTPPVQHGAAELSDTLSRVSRVKHGDVLLQRAMGDKLDDIAVDRGLSRERIRQMEVSARRELARAA